MDLCQVHLGDLQMVEGIPAALPSLPRWDSCTGRTLLISPCHPLLYPELAHLSLRPPGSA